jgi:hypothetical protein
MHFVLFHKVSFTKLVRVFDLHFRTAVPPPHHPAFLHIAAGLDFQKLHDKLRMAKRMIPMNS